MTDNAQVIDVTEFNQQSAEERLDAAVTLWQQNAALWALKGGEGLFLLETDNETALPLWPDALLASHFADRYDLQAQAFAVSLEQFRGVWAQGLMQDDISVLVAPTAMQGEDMLLTAEDLLAMIDEAQA